MATPPKPSTDSYWDIFASTATSYAQQEKLLKEEADKKEQAIQKLREVDKQFALFTGQLNATTEKTQTLLSQTPIKKSLPNTLTPTKCRDPQQQLEQVLAIAQLAQKGEALQKLNKDIQELNKTCGHIKANAKALEAAAQDYDSLIQKMEELVANRKKTVNSAKETLERAQEASQIIKS